jgi:hypothetical protein
MGYCDYCQHARWDKTRIGYLSPTRNGHCQYPYQVPELPKAMYWMGQPPQPSGGFIVRGVAWERECPYFSLKTNPTNPS